MGPRGVAPLLGRRVSWIALEHTDWPPEALAGGKRIEPVWWRADSNRGPLAPKASALPGCATPRIERTHHSAKVGGRCPVRFGCDPSFPLPPPRQSAAHPSSSEPSPDRQLIAIPFPVDTLPMPRVGLPAPSGGKTIDCYPLSGDILWLFS